MKSILKLLTLFIPIIFICGCVDPQPIVIQGGDSTSKTNGTTNAVALIFSLENVNKNAYDGWDGDCPGTHIDSTIFANFCTEQKIPYYRFKDSNCTYENLVKYWKESISKLNPTNGLLVFFYSGHGGQVYSPTESDGLDETLCLWDGQLIDDRIWDLLCMVPSKCRIFMVTDCCNSETNFRLPFNMANSKRKPRGLTPNLLHFGGCQDGKSSYGSNRGGVFTAYLKSLYSPDKTYEQWFNETKSAMKGQLQVPTFAETGVSFKKEKIFK